MKTKVALILSQFPEQYETFLLREIVEMKKAGLDLSIFSLKKCKDKIIHPESKKFQRKTHYSNFIFSGKLIFANLIFLISKPLKYISTLCYIFFQNLRSPVFLIKSLLLFPESVYFARIIENENISIVHGYWATFPATSAIIISRLTGIPFSFTGHAHDIYLDTTMLIEKMLKARFVATCTANNKTYLLSLAKKKISSEDYDKLEQKICINYHGVNLSKFKRDRKKSKKSEDSKISILSVGSLLKCKGFDILIDACETLLQNNLNFHCTIVGGGPLKDQLTKQIENSNLINNVTITGNLTQEELLPYFKTADVFALPVRLEIHWGIPNVLIEAIASGVPVITTNLPSISELIQDGRTGFVIPEKNPKLLAEKITEIVKNPHLHKTIVDNAYQVVNSNFDRSKNAANLVHLFQKYGD